MKDCRIHLGSSKRYICLHHYQLTLNIIKGNGTLTIDYNIFRLNNDSTLPLIGLGTVGMQGDKRVVLLNKQIFPHFV